MCRVVLSKKWLLGLLEATQKRMGTPSPLLSAYLKTALNQKQLALGE